MSRTGPVASIARVGDRIGRLSAQHIHTTFRALLHGPGTFGDETCAGIVTREPHPFGNIAVVTDGDDVAATTAALRPLLAYDGPAALACTSGAVAADVSAYLESEGFTSSEVMPAMAADIERLHVTALPAGYEFVRTGPGAEGDAWTACLAVGYELPIAVAAMFAPNRVGADPAADARFQFFAILKDGRHVCTSMLHLADGVAGVYCVATVPEERGKGLGAHATAEPLRIVSSLGYRVAVLQSSAAGHGVYRRLGFADYRDIPLHVRMPSA